MFSVLFGPRNMFLSFLILECCLISTRLLYAQEFLLLLTLCPTPLWSNRVQWIVCFLCALRLASCLKQICDQFSEKFHGILSKYINVSLVFLAGWPVNWGKVGYWSYCCTGVICDFTVVFGTCDFKITLSTWWAVSPVSVKWLFIFSQLLWLKPVFITCQWYLLASYCLSDWNTLFYSFTVKCVSVMSCSSWSSQVGDTCFVIQL